MVEIPTEFYEWSPVQWPHAVETELEAMMASPPHGSVDSLDHKMTLREALVECFDQLCPEDRYVIDAFCFERITIRELADRLGIEKSRTHRIKDRALRRLGAIAQVHPVVIDALERRG